LDSTGRLGERNARAHFLDSLAMVDLVEGDQHGARHHLEEAARIAAEVGNPSLDMTVSVHKAFALLAAGDLAAAAGQAAICAEQLAGPDAGMHAAIAIEHAALTACLALAAGDQAGAAAGAAEMTRRADLIGHVRYRNGARRISAAIGAAAGAAAAPPPAGLPRLVWVDDTSPVGGGQAG
jgi:hypothetical protein